MVFVVKSIIHLWDAWNIRGLIILSLFLQCFLMLIAPLRKQIGGKWIIRTSIWLAYLLADWVATFTIGLLLRAEHRGIWTFWAPFLLLHLGGPDSITSFSQGDNDFWIRHLLGLILQVGSTVYLIFDQPIPQNKLLLPTLLVLTAGIIKYAERNCAFYLACFDHYGDKVTNYSFLEKTEVDANGKDLSKGKFLKELTPYGTIKNLLLGPLLSSDRRALSQNAFSKMSPQKVLRMIEIELSLLYDALHTKFPVVHSKIGYVCRIISFCCIVGALLSFSLLKKHCELSKLEIRLTYGLLIGAITLDVISIGLFIFSDFNILTHHKFTLRLGEQQNQEIKIMVWDPKCENEDNGVMKGRRWSKRISQYNFTNYCRSRNQNLRFIRSNFNTTSSKIREDREWRFIFEELKRKAQQAETVEMAQGICLKRGDGILESNTDYMHLIWSVKNLDYTESLLTWHLATEFCFLDDLYKSPTSDYREISKLLSDYMFYLVEMEPVIMATVSTGRKEELRRAQKEALGKAFNHLRSILSGQFLSAREMSKVIFSDFNPNWLIPSGNEKKPIFSLARMLASQLKYIDGFPPWELMSQVWVEIMCHAAINCRPDVHAQQPSKGGELITFVWLLMNHLGLGTQFSAEEKDPFGYL